MLEFFNEKDKKKVRDNDLSLPNVLVFSHIYDVYKNIYPKYL